MSLPATFFHKQPHILIWLWLLVNMLVYYQFGIVTSFESEKYIAAADHLIRHGNLGSGQYTFYAIPILIIAAAKVSGTFPVLPVVIQLVMNAIATWCFYNTAFRISADNRVATGATASLIGMFYYQQYNTHLFTESLYFSLSIIFFSLLQAMQHGNIRNFSLLILLLVVLYFTRPVGLFFIPATFLYIVLKLYRSKALPVFAVTGLVIATIFFLLLDKALGAGGEFDFLIPYTHEHIICGVPTTATPHKLYVPANQNSLQGILYVITHNWQLFCSLAAKRLLAFFGVVRSYYSPTHNLFVAIYFFSIYALVINGIRHWRKRQHPEIAFMLSIIFFTACTAMVSCDDWHNRFLLSTLPFLILLTLPSFTKKSATHTK